MPLLARRNSEKVPEKAGDEGERTSIFRRLSRRSTGLHGSESKAKGPVDHVTEVATSDKKSDTTAAPGSYSDAIAATHPMTSPTVNISDSPRSSSAESTTRPQREAKGHHPTTVSGPLSKGDVRHLFSGAPHFTLEKGGRGRYFPQAFFPWNTTLEISDLQDRRYLRHESFSLATLHAHLPIPDEVSWKPGMRPPVKRDGLETGKRPMFELEIYERPNMLSIEGHEPGTVGLRWFLEHPVADGVASADSKEHSKDVDMDLEFANLPVAEAFRLISGLHDDGKAKVGKRAPKQDRAQLVRDGPPAWRRVGVRNISMTTLTERLELLSKLRDEMVNEGWKVTVLNKISGEELQRHLFEELLYPPQRLLGDGRYTKPGLKGQIEALVKVLTTPGAWLDLSVPEARLRFGQILHGPRARRVNNINSTLTPDDEHKFTAGAERKWLLVQLLLSVELVIRLDAALRLGVARHSETFEVTSNEIHHFNKMRNLKVDWDLVAARRCLDLCHFRKIEKVSPAEARPTSPKLERRYSDHHFIEGFRHTLHLREEKHEEMDSCDCAVLPRQPRAMVDGVVRFASNIGWPRCVGIGQRLEEKLCQSEARRQSFLLGDTEEHHTRGAERHPEPTSAIIPPLDGLTVQLEQATPTTIGSWLSRTWLSGLVLPGPSACDLLICTLLENDDEAISKLGSSSAHLHAGFTLDGHSWWSKRCIVGRVMASFHQDCKENMGWISTPKLLPIYDGGKERPKGGNGWIRVKTYPPPKLRETARIYDGERLSLESTPLGVGHGKILGAEFSMVTDHILDILPHVQVQNMQLHLSETDLTPHDHALAAWVGFDISHGPDDSRSKQHVAFSLHREVFFVTAYPCRVPHGHATTSSGHSEPVHHEHPHHRHAERLPAHPLHKTYKYKTKSLLDLLEPGVEPPDPTDKHHDLWIVDARGNDQHNVFVRAWCAEKGRHAIVSRVGWSCLSCTIREAKALEVGVVIRVGVRESDHLA